jgi:hypothetical protein
MATDGFGEGVDAGDVHFAGPVLDMRPALPTPVQLSKLSRCAVQTKGRAGPTRTAREVSLSEPTGLGARRAPRQP